MFDKIKIKHKTEGWTGTLEITDVEPRGYSSHRQSFTAELHLEQDAYKPDGTYVEDPNVNSLDELEVLKT